MTADDQLVELLLPRLLARIAPLSARIQELLALASAGSSVSGFQAGEQLAETSGDAELERLRDVVERLGWALGRVTAAADADAMGPRHRADGLAVLLTEVEELLVVGELPLLAPGGRELWIAAALVLHLPGGCGAGRTESGWRLTWDAPSDLAEHPAYRRLAATDAQLVHAAGTWSLDVPATWLHHGQPFDQPN